MVDDISPEEANKKALDIFFKGMVERDESGKVVSRKRDSHMMLRIMVAIILVLPLTLAAIMISEKTGVSQFVTVGSVIVILLSIVIYAGYKRLKLMRAYHKEVQKEMDELLSASGQPQPTFKQYVLFIMIVVVVALLLYPILS